MNESSFSWPTESRDSFPGRSPGGPISPMTLNILYLLQVPEVGRTDGLGDTLWANLKLMILLRSSLGAAASAELLL